MIKYLMIFIRAKLFDWPVYRVTYSNGERTYPLSYNEAYGQMMVFDGKIWLDYDYAKRLMYP